MTTAPITPPVGELIDAGAWILALVERDELLAVVVPATVDREQLARVIAPLGDQVVAWCFAGTLLRVASAYTLAAYAAATTERDRVEALHTEDCTAKVKSLGLFTGSVLRTAAAAARPCSCGIRAAAIELRRLAGLPGEPPCT